MIDYTITIGNIVEIAAIIGGGALFAISLRNDVSGLKKNTMAMQEEIKGLSAIVTKMAVAENRLDNADTRITNVEQDIRELRHGEGFVRSGPRGIDREYP